MPAFEASVGSYKIFAMGRGSLNVSTFTWLSNMAIKTSLLLVFQPRAIAGTFALLGLMGCVSNPPVSTPQAAPVLPQPQPQTRGEAQKELGALGWKLLSVSGPNNDRSLEFLRPTSYSKADDITRITTYTVNGNEAMAKYRSRSSMFAWEMNCSAKTARIVDHKSFSDVMGRTKIYDAAVKDAKFIPIVEGSVPSYLFAQVCASGPSSGSGVMVGINRVLTANHVVDRCTAIEAVFEGKRYPAQLLAQDSKNDLGVLQVNSIPNVRSVSLRNKAVIGETVMAAGYPLSGILSSDLTVTTGNVNSLAGLADNQNQLQISAQVSPGNSGGGLIDKSGNLVGLVVSKLDVLRLAALTGDMAQNVNFAVKPEVIRTFLDTNGVRIAAMDAGSRLESETLAARAKEFTVKLECKSKPPMILTSL
jgi:S1-C subfamily serine protease